MKVRTQYSFIVSSLITMQTFNCFMDEGSAPQVRHTRPCGQLPTGEEAPPNPVTHRHPRVAQLVPPPQKRVTERKSLKDPEISTKKCLQFQDLQLKHKFSEKQVIYK